MVAGEDPEEGIVCGMPRAGAIKHDVIVVVDRGGLAGNR